MRSKASVEHKGVVEKISDSVIRVGFVSHSACSGCHAKGACSLSDVENKYVDIKNEGGSYQPGEPVDIILEQKQGFRALWLGYILPLLVMLTTLLIVVAITGREGLAGIIAVLILIPYYVLLYLFRNKVKEKFEFKIRKSA